MRTALVVMVFGVLWAQPAAAELGEVVGGRTPVANVPVMARAKIEFELEPGTLVCIFKIPVRIEVEPGWLLIGVPNGSGYVRESSIRLVAPEQSERHAQAASVCAEVARLVDKGEAELAARRSSLPLDPAPAPAPAPPQTTRSEPLASWSWPSPTSTRPLATPSSSVPPPTREPDPAVGNKKLLHLAPYRFTLGIGTGAAWLRKQSAEEHNIGEMGVTFNLSLGLTLYDILAFSVTGGAAFPSDNASFEQDVVPLIGGGDPSTAESDLEVQSYSAAAGLRTPFYVLAPSENRIVAGALFVDYGTSEIRGRRSISNCSDCRTDDLDMASGTFWRAGFDLLFTRPYTKYGFSLNGAYQRYEASAGLTDEVRLAMLFWL